MFKQLDGEMWLAKRLEAHGTHVFAGLTTREQRRERFRAAIETVGPSVIAGRGKGGKAETYAQVFERLFHEPLALRTKVPAGSRESQSERTAPGAQR